MALLKDRREDVIEGSFYMSATATMGVIANLSTGSSGAGMDDAAALAAVAAVGSGTVPLGFLLYDVVNLDLTRQRINHIKPETQVGTKVPILRRGWVCTDQIIGTPSAGNTAYVYNSGKVSATQLSAGNPAVGVFLTSKDSDGFAKVEINLP